MIIKAIGFAAGMAALLTVFAVRGFEDDKVPTPAPPQVEDNFHAAWVEAMAEVEQSNNVLHKSDRLLVASFEPKPVKVESVVPSLTSAIPPIVMTQEKKSEPKRVAEVEHNVCTRNHTRKRKVWIRKGRSWRCTK
jgi:hypothetical protein